MVRVLNIAVFNLIFRNIAMNGFAGVFLEMRARELNRFLNATNMDIDFAAHHHRQFVLADLIAFRQVGVKIILARENRTGRNLGIHRQTEFDRTFDCAFIQHR